MHQQLIPERDSGPVPRPKPRSKPSTRPTNNKSTDSNKFLNKQGNENDIDDVISLSSISSASNGFDNHAYSHNEPDVSFPAMEKSRKYYSSDSETENNNVVRNHVFSADVHNLPLRSHKSSTAQSESEDNIPTKLQSPPRPKPRSKSPYKDSDASTDSKATTSTDSQQYGHKPIPRARKKSPKSSPKKDHLVIPMPPNKDEATPESSKAKQGKREAKSFVSKWKSAAENLITKVPTTKKSSTGRGDKMKGLPETRIEIQDLDPSSTENIEMASFSKPGPSSSSGVTVTQDTVETISETKVSKRTKAMLKRQDDKEIKKLKETINPVVEQEITSQVSTPSKRQRRRAQKTEQSDKFLGVTIHNCDLLPIDPNIVHPVVKVILLNEDGTVLEKTKSTNNTTSPDRHDKKHDKKDKRKARDKQPEGKSVKGKDSGSRPKEDLPATKFSPTSVLPIMTQPCKLGYYLPTFAPMWNELLVFEEPFARTVHPDSTAILFFEVMDFLPASGAAQVGSKLFKEYHGSEEGWYKIAWGFLKLIGANGARNINRKIRLQLYKPENLPSQLKADGIEVYQWWKLQRRHKINSTLYVTVKAVPPIPSLQSSNLNTLLTMKKDDLNNAILDSQLSPTNSKRGDSSAELDRKAGQTDVRLPQWRRLEGQICKIPNKMLKSLPSSPVESLNLTICGNVQCVKFSPCGLKLAAGLDTDEMHTVIIFEMPKGKILSNIRCHHGIIYDLDWKILDDESGFVPKSYYLASASADMTATVWEVYAASGSPPKLIKKLLHPAYVYCVKIHPTKSNLIFTGCFDYAIRIWDVRKASPSRADRLNPETESVPLVLLDRHASFINCLAFDSVGHHMYSGDGSGCVYEWESGSSGRRKSWKVSREMNFREAGKNPINSIQVHPSGNRLLVHVRNSAIRIVDLGSLLTLYTLTGLVNDKLQVRSMFSPCGNLVLSGSEDSTLCIWDADTGSVLQFVTPENHRHCVVTSVDYHPHDYYVVIGVASTISEPSPIILYTHKQAKPAKLRLKTLSKLASLNKSSSLSTEIMADDQEIPELTAKGFGMERGDSSEKFIMIVKKLDAALKVARKSRSGIPPPGTTSPAKIMEAPTPKTDPFDQAGVEGSGEGPKMVVSSRDSGDVFTNGKFKVAKKSHRMDQVEEEYEKPTKELTEDVHLAELETPTVKVKYSSMQKHDITISSLDGDNWDSPTKNNNSGIRLDDKYSEKPEKLRNDDSYSSSTPSGQVSRVRQKRRERRRMLDD